MCGVPKDESEFYPQSASGKRGNNCKKCHCACCKSYRKGRREKIAVQKKGYYQENKEAAGDKKLLRKFGLSRLEWEKMKSDQGGVCPICQNPPKGGHGFCVDHDHVTGKVRALLCNLCNAALGMLQDSSELTLRAANYLKRHGK